MTKEEMVIENLKESLKPISEIQGVKDPDVIIKNLLVDNMFSNEVAIMRNDRFKMVFIKGENGEMKLMTTFSNQEITESYMKELQLLQSNSGWIGHNLICVLNIMTEA